jgi:hypothetical protein
MIKNKIIKAYNWLLSNTTKHKWFESHFRMQLISLLEWFIYPEFRRKNKFIEVIKQNKLILIIGMLFIFWTTGFFSIGRWLSFTEKKEAIYSLEYRLDKANDILYYTNNMLCRKDSTISQLRETMDSRDYLQFIVKRDCNLKNYDNLTKLSDEVFFTMIDEIEKYQIPYTIFFRVVDHESGFKFIPNSQGSGAMGYCQVMPLTFQTVSKRLGFKVHNEVNNIKTGAYVMKNNYDGYKKKGLDNKTAWHKALTDYSGGDSELASSEIKYYKTDLVK